MTAPAPAFAVQRLDHVVLRVRDLDIAEAFYREVLAARWCVVGMISACAICVPVPR